MSALIRRRLVSGFGFLRPEVKAAMIEAFDEAVKESRARQKQAKPQAPPQK